MKRVETRRRFVVAIEKYCRTVSIPRARARDTGMIKDVNDLYLMYSLADFYTRDE